MSLFLLCLVAVMRRESDGYEPGCSQYRVNVRHVSGPKS